MTCGLIAQLLYRGSRESLDTLLSRGLKNVRNLPMPSVVTDLIRYIAPAVILSCGGGLWHRVLLVRHLPKQDSYTPRGSELGQVVSAKPDFASEDTAEAADVTVVWPLGLAAEPL
jgi:hypothetical protein